MRITDRAAVLMALDDAIQWQQEYREANAGFDQKQVDQANRAIIAYRRVYGRLTGGKATMREIGCMSAMQDSEVLSVTEIRRRIDTGEIKARTIEGGILERVPACDTKERDG